MIQTNYLQVRTELMNRIAKCAGSDSYFMIYKTHVRCDKCANMRATLKKMHDYVIEYYENRFPPRELRFEVPE